MFTSSNPLRDTDEGYERAMREPSIFKGCHGTNGPLTADTKDAILCYLGRPRSEAWEIIKNTAVVPGITLGDVWCLSQAGRADRLPDAGELVRSIRLAVKIERQPNG